MWAPFLFFVSNIHVFAAANTPALNKLPSSRDFGGNKFGMGVYNDTHNPDLTLQLPETRTLVGDGGQVLLFFSLLFVRTGDPSSCKNNCLPEQWVLNALQQAYKIGLKPTVRLGQWSRQIRDFSDDRDHRNFISLAKAYKTYLSALPRPPDGSNLPVILLNEPNVCGEWQCAEGAGIYLESEVAAAEVASCLRDLLAAAKTLPRLKVAVAPLAYAAPVQCECTQPGHNIAPNFSQPNNINYIQSMRNTVPELWANADFFAAHAYPFGNQPFSTPLGRAGILDYQPQLQAIGRNGSIDDFPVVIGKTGWKGPDEQMKADSMVAAYREVFLEDPAVVAVLPFLLAGYDTSTVFADFRWVTWFHNGSYERSLQWQATRNLRCSLEIGGPC
jgi:hypothetical protein